MAHEQLTSAGLPSENSPSADLRGIAGWPARGLAWTRQHRAATDRILTALLAAVSVSSIWLVPWSNPAHNRSPGAGAVLLALAAVAPLLARRQRPDLVLVASGTALLAYDALNYPSGLVFLATFWAVYSYGCHRRRNSQWPLVIWVGEILAHLAVARQNDPSQTVLIYLAVTMFVFVRGDAVRSGLIRVAREKEARALQAVADERVRIARELHDVVAHALGVIVMQAGGASSVPDLAAADAKTVLANIERTGRSESLVSLARLEADRVAPGSQAIFTKLADVLLSQALRTQLNRADQNRWHSIDADTRVEQAVRLLSQHPDRPWTLGLLAREVGMSRTQLAACFRASIGDSPMRHLARVRLNLAAWSLVTSDKSVEAIARRTGYASSASLSKAFRREFGIPPGTYRAGTPSVTVRELESVR